MITLALDASTHVGDVAVISGSEILAEANVAMRDPHRERLMPAVAEVLSKAGVRASDLDRIVCGSGPGSFTSLRIAGAIAKGLATALERPLYTVSSLALVAAGAERKPGGFLVAVDALRGEYYVALYDVARSGAFDAIGSDSIVARRPARLVPADDVDSLAAEFGATILSPTSRPDAVQAFPRACGVVRLWHTIEHAGPADRAGWEPAYGRLAEAQVRWEQAHGRPLPAG
jgi:tRNA threonylcarbamoyladenosine biosynthesis protein TsaB